MSSKDKRTEEIIAETMEEAMRGILDALNEPDNSRGMGDRNEESEEGFEEKTEEKLHKTAQKKASGSPKKRKTRKKNPDRASVSSDGDISISDQIRETEDEDDDMEDDAAGDMEEAKDGDTKEGSAQDMEEDGEDDTENNDIRDIEEDDDHGDTEDEEDQPGRRSRRGRRNRKKGVKIAAIAAAGVLGLAAAVYAGAAVYFNSHFLFNTKINGTDCSLKSVEEAEDYMKKHVADYTLTLEESGGGQESIDGAAIAIEYVPGGQLGKFMEEQDNFLWPKSLWNDTDKEMEIGVKYDEAALAEVTAGLGCMNPETQTPSTDAHPQFQEGQFVVAPEIVGTQINAEVFNAKVAEAINGFKPSLNLSESGCYALPRFVSDSPEVVAAKDAMNSYLGANITYDFNPHTEVVDASVISQWVMVDGDMNVSFNQDAVRAYVQSLAEKYDTKGRARPFTTASGNVVTVEGGGYGWQMDQEAEFNTLLANIQNGETVTREAVYLSRGASHGDSDVGNTYAEVDLTNQRMYFIQNGQVVLQSDCVTGNPNRGNATPQGWYSLAWKQRNRTLRGTRRPDGTYEYETPVKYWMPFNGGIGFHDAPWQASFGGQRYRTHGSHGCVNLPTSVAGQLYELLMDGMPVVCHY